MERPKRSETTGCGPGVVGGTEGWVDFGTWVGGGVVGCTGA